MPRQSFGRPGSRAPHVWLEQGGGTRKSTIDLFGRAFVLLTGRAGGSWQEAALSIARDIPGLELEVHSEPAVLAAYGIPVPETLVATNEGEAVRLAAKIGYPVVLKLHSETITHKSDVGGVQLNLSDEAAVRAAYASTWSRAIRPRAK